MKNLYLLASFAIVVPVIFLFITSHNYDNKISDSAQDPFQQASELFNLPTPEQLYGFEIDSLQLVKSVLEVNENLGEILSAYNVSPATIANIAQLPRDIFDVRALKAKKPYTIIQASNSDTTALGFVYHPNPIDYIALKFIDSLEIIRGQHAVDTLTHTMGGYIDNSLYESILAQGGNPAIVNKLFDIFAWDIDFWALQAGDRYKIIYQTYEVEGEAAGLGNIVAAEIFHEGTPYFAFGYDQQEGNGWEYFDEKGSSRQGIFLRAPLQYTRISSRFSHSRLHPILKRRRPHYGVDFAAPYGTPVHAIGDGVVVTAGYSGGAGNMVKIRHTQGFMSGYLHLSRRAGGIRMGATVKQGQIIGYVGSTGLSTGPHLDFRIWKNQIPVDPLRLAKPKSKEICNALSDDFQYSRESYQNDLEKINITKVNLANTDIQF